MSAFLSSTTEIELIKWSLPLVLSVVALWKSFADSKRSKIESSSRARQQLNSDLRRWTADCITVFSEASKFSKCTFDGSGSMELCAKFSSLADQGRLFFPNPLIRIHDLERAAAYKGYRPRILDWLIYSFNLVQTIRSGPDREACNSLWDLRKGFVSDTQIAINPRNLYTNLEEFQVLLEKGEFMDTTQSHPTLRAVEEIIRRRKNQHVVDHKSEIDPSHWV